MTEKIEKSRSYTFSGFHSDNVTIFWPVLAVDYQHNSAVGRKADIQIRVAKPLFEAVRCHAYRGKSSLFLGVCAVTGYHPTHIHALNTKRYNRSLLAGFSHVFMAWRSARVQIAIG